MSGVLSEDCKSASTVGPCTNFKFAITFKVVCLSCECKAAVSHLTHSFLFKHEYERDASV